MPSRLLEPATRNTGIAARAVALTALSGLLAGLMLALATPEPSADGRARPAGPAAAQVSSRLDGGTTPSGPVAFASDRLAHPVAHAAPPADPDTAEADLAQQLERHALNALLVPILDDEADQPSWADPSLSLPCGPATRVAVDHRPLRPGTPQTGRSFMLSWQLDHCAPFGTEGPVLTGQAELDVFRDDEGVSAIVRFQGLRAERQGRQVWMDKTFTARMP